MAFTDNNNWQFPTGSNNPQVMPSAAPAQTYSPPTAGQIGTQQGAGQIGWTTRDNSTTLGTNGVAPPPSTGAFGQTAINLGNQGTTYQNTGNLGLASGTYTPQNVGGANWWRNFQFQNPTEDWQKNFNSISDPIARMMYGFQSGQGTSGFMDALQKSGLSGQQVQDLRKGFENHGQDADPYWKALGMTGNPQGDAGSYQQIGNQFYKIVPASFSNGVYQPATKQLIQDFGNGTTMFDSTYDRSPLAQSNWASLHGNESIFAPKFQGTPAPTPPDPALGVQGTVYTGGKPFQGLQQSAYGNPPIPVTKTINKNPWQPGRFWMNRGGTR